jgi:hypothetical protein
MAAPRAPSLLYVERSPGRVLTRELRGGEVAGPLAQVCSRRVINDHRPDSTATP